MVSAWIGSGAGPRWLAAALALLLGCGANDAQDAGPDLRAGADTADVTLDIATADTTADAAPDNGAGEADLLADAESDVGPDVDAEDAASDAADLDGDAPEEAADTPDAPDEAGAGDSLFDADGSEGGALDTAVDVGEVQGDTALDSSDGSDVDAEVATTEDAVDGDADAAPLPLNPTLTELEGPYLPVDPDTLPAAPFADITKDLGLDPIATMGACVAAGDLDNDGDDDFLLVDLAASKAAIRSVLLDKGKAVHVLTIFDTTLLVPSTGCAVADMNADGKLDLLVGGHSGAGLYLGDGKGKFKDASDEFLPYIMDFATLTIAPVDIDGDLDLDVFVGAGVTPVTPGGGGPACGTISCGFTLDDFICSFKFPFPESPAELQDRMLIRGAKLPLVDATTAWKVPSGGIWSNAFPIDLDMDGKMDMIVGDDFGAHRYLRNKGGVFEAFATDIGFHSYGHAMGWGVGDFNADGKPDLVMADAGPSPVFVQVPPDAGKPVGFVDKGGAFGVWSPSWTASSWAPLVADFDHDGKDDVMLGISISAPLGLFPFIAAGCMPGGGGVLYQGHPNQDLIFLSGQGSPFGVYNFPSGPFSHFAMVTHATLDLDGDGDLDLVQTRPNVNQTGMVRVLRNEIGVIDGKDTKGLAFQVLLTGKDGNLDAIGARVTAQISGVLRTRWLTGTGGTGGTRTRRAHFGLGQAKAAQAVTVHWPDGKTTLLGSVAAGAIVKATWP